MRKRKGDYFATHPSDKPGQNSIYGQLTKIIEMTVIELVVEDSIELF